MDLSQACPTPVTVSPVTTLVRQSLQLLAVSSTSLQPLQHLIENTRSMLSTIGSSSAFPDSLSSLKRSRQSLQRVTNNLKSCVEVFDRQTKDLPRLATVTQNTEFYELVSISEIRAAQIQITSELEPQLKELLLMAEKGLERLQTREQLLRTTIARRDAAYEDKEDEGTVQNVDDDEDDDRRKLIQVRAQKESLVEELDKLEREVKKKRLIIKNLSRAH